MQKLVLLKLKLIPQIQISDHLYIRSIALFTGALAYQGLLNTAPNPVAVLPILVLPSVLKLPICVNMDPSEPTVVDPIRV